MSWRTFFYSLTVLFAAIVVATTASSDVADQPVDPTLAAVISMEGHPIPERSSRVALMVIGIGAVAFTFQRGFTNLKKPGS
jgi:hypothetical protein